MTVDEHEAAAAVLLLLLLGSAMEHRRGPRTATRDGRDRAAASRSGGGRASPGRLGQGGGVPRGGGQRQRGEINAEDASLLMEPAVQRQIQQMVREQVARQVGKAVEAARADVELKTERKIKEGLDAILRTVKSMKQARARETALAPGSASVAREGADRSAHESEPALVTLRQRMEQIENHVESYLRRHGQSNEELAQRVDTVERQLHDTVSRSAGPTVRALDAEEFDARLALVEGRIEEVCHSQEQDTMHLRRQIAQMEEHRQAMQVLSEHRGPPDGEQLARDDVLGQQRRQLDGRQLEEQQRSDRNSIWRLEKRQAELESTMKRLLQKPAIATGLKGRPLASDTSIAPESSPHDTGTTCVLCPTGSLRMLWTGPISGARPQAH